MGAGWAGQRDVVIRKTRIEDFSSWAWWEDERIYKDCLLWGLPDSLLAGTCVFLLFLLSYQIVISLVFHYLSWQVKGLGQERNLRLLKSEERISKNWQGLWELNISTGIFLFYSEILISTVVFFVISACSPWKTGNNDEWKDRKKPRIPLPSRLSPSQTCV